MGYEYLTLKNELTVSSIVSIHYFEYMNDFSFPGESHNFWEFLCVDKGEVIVQAGSASHILKKGQIIFHKPNEFHDVNANGKIAPNLVVISFQCDSPAMDFFCNRILDITEKERSLMAKIISERKRCIVSPLNNPHLKKLELLPKPAFGSQQLIRLYLEELLLLMIRRSAVTDCDSRPVKSVRQKTDALVYERITAYLEGHVQEQLSLDTICRDNMISHSQIQKLFRKYNHSGVIDYFCQLKIERAKLLIRENHYNFTQIAEFLGYTSVHYFSRQFKKVAAMTPSEYASSIKIFSDS